MKVAILAPVEKFINSLDEDVRADVYGLIDLLQQYGHTLPMPYAKPIGRGLWELRKTGRPQMRILYGFCGGEAVLLVIVKKQRSVLRSFDIELALKRLNVYCG